MNKKKLENKKWLSHDEFLKLTFSEDAIKRAEEKFPEFLRQMREEVKKETAEKVKKLRQKEGLSQSDVARILKTTRQNVSQMESGKRNMTLENLASISHALGKELEIRFK
jgi:DNA-binding transcriptional regulator YiaG